jgi:hypothetical protein
VDRLTPLLLAALLGCGGTHVAVAHPEFYPVDFSGIDDAFFFPYGGSADDGYGVGLVLLTADDLTCDDVSALVSDGGPLPGSSGLLLDYEWVDAEEEDAGWRGIYAVGGQVFTDGGRVERRAVVMPFSDGVPQVLYAITGSSEITDLSDAEVRGTVATDVIDATFEADRCGDLAHGEQR